MRYLIVVSACLSLFACQTRTVSIRLPVAVEDRPDQRQLVVKYQNETRLDVCMAVEDWPNQYGGLHEASDYVYLLVEGARYPYKSIDMGYCVGLECTMKIVPQQEVVASIPYERFALPENLHARQKVLIYSPAAHFCTKESLRRRKSGDDGVILDKK